MFELYTERAKRVLAFAKYEASQMGSDTMQIAALAALSRLVRALEVEPPAYVYAPSELRRIADAFDALAASPVSLAILCQADGLVAASIGRAPAALETWIDRILPDLEAMPRTGSRASVSFRAPDGKALHLAWIAEGVFLLVVPSSPEALAPARDAAEAAAASLRSVYSPPDAGDEAAAGDTSATEPVRASANVSGEEDRSMDLASKQCIPCRGGVPPLEGEELARLASQLDGWKVEDTPARKGHHLSKGYVFADFAQALAYVNRVGAMAEEQGHHPDLHLAWGKVRVDVWTHKIDGLTESDFVFAAKCDRLL